MDLQSNEPIVDTENVTSAKPEWAKPVLRKLDLNEALHGGARPNNDGSFPFS
jgi:hypothetical protein